MNNESGSTAALRVPCPMCDGAGYIENGARRDETCAGCEGSGAGLRCRCGAETVPSVARVTHEASADDHDEAIHTPERCARYCARDGWEEWDGAGMDGWECVDGMPDWCEPFAGGRS
jgi:RecJ-like exonuclease